MSARVSQSALCISFGLVCVNVIHLLNLSKNAPRTNTHTASNEIAKSLKSNEGMRRVKHTLRKRKSIDDDDGGDDGNNNNNNNNTMPK